MSFRKRVGAETLQPVLGTRVSSVSGKSVCSFGVASLDSSVGECAVGSLTLINSDRCSDYARLIASYFAAQAIASGNVLAVAASSLSALSSPEKVTNDGTGVTNPANSSACEQFVQRLMLKIDDTDADSAADDADSEDVDLGSSGVGSNPRTLGLASLRSDRDKMAIAWRYQAMPRISSPASVTNSAASAGPYCCKFDITKTIAPATLDAASIALISVETWASLTSAELYTNLLDSIRSIIDQGKFRNSVNSLTPNLLRIVLEDVGSPSWGIDAGSETALKALFKFLTCLRVLLRDSRAVCMLTISAYTFKGHHVGISTNPYMQMLQHACDLVLEVESFSGSKRSFSDHFTTEYHGFLHVHKTPLIHTLSGTSRLSASDIHSLAFKARRKRFLVEPFRLPPEKEDVPPSSSGANASTGASGSGKEAGAAKRASKNISAVSGCGVEGGGKSLLDF
ncbi:Elongator subunit elp4 [Chytriomyces hyalinus]|nr:Elongator subunit elp4 [Chytriomyces hyalinus]